MAAFCSREWWSDARQYQIVALATLLVYNVLWVDFGAQPLNSLLAIGGALATQALCTYLFALPEFDPRSPLITGLSLSLLLRTEEPWLHAVAAVIAIGSKFVFRVDGKHIWNPAGFAIVLLLLGANGVWISPGQWGSTVWFATLLCFFAILVLRAARRSDIAIVPPAPPRFSVTNCCPRPSLSFASRIRLTVSAPPPAGYGTITLTGRAG
jgi:Na+-transporting NADH:ubiquinone oxidoreductase subunit NqrB